MIKFRFFSVLFALVISTLISSSVQAQKTISVTTQSPSPCSGEKFVMPSSIESNDEGFLRYMSIVAASGRERNKIFGSLSNEQKAGIVRFQYAMQFAKRSNLTKEQSSFLLDTMSKVSPDAFDKTNSEKIRASNAMAQDIEMRGLSLFARKDAFDILSGLQGDKHEDAELLQNYVGLLNSGTMERRKILRNMPIAEQLKIWKTQLAFHLALSRLTGEQRKFIVEIIPNIQTIIESATNLSKEERIAYRDNLESSIFKIFSKTEAYAIFMEVGIQKKVADVPDSPSNLIQDCNCRWYCSEDNQSCGGTCRIVTYCGPFDTWECTAKCTVS